MLVTASVLSDTRQPDYTLSVLLLFWEDILLGLLVAHGSQALTDQPHDIFTTDHYRSVNFA